MGWLLLLPLFIAFWLVLAISNACAKRGGLLRFVAVAVSIIIGGICIQVGYWFGIEGFTEWRDLKQYQATYPVLGWIIMIGGGIIALLGIWTALARNKREIELREEMESIDRERKIEEKYREEAITLSTKWLENGKIDNQEQFNNIVNFMNNRQWDLELKELSIQLRQLQNKNK